MILHTVNKEAALSGILKLIADEDALLFLEDGVYCLLNRAAKHPTDRVYALHSDVEARGLTTRIDSGIELVSHNEFVRLCCEARSVSSWF